MALTHVVCDHLPTTSSSGSCLRTTTPSVVGPVTLVEPSSNVRVSYRVIHSVASPKVKPSMRSASATADLCATNVLSVICPCDQRKQPQLATTDYHKAKRASQWPTRSISCCSDLFCDAPRRNRTYNLVIKRLLPRCWPAQTRRVRARTSAAWLCTSCADRRGGPSVSRSSFPALGPRLGTKWPLPGHMLANPMRRPVDLTRSLMHPTRSPVNRIRSPRSAHLWHHGSTRP
jgi:hypothetical protein